jgi:hypothetical protein
LICAIRNPLLSGGNGVVQFFQFSLLVDFPKRKITQIRDIAIFLYSII